MQIMSDFADDDLPAWRFALKVPRTEVRMSQQASKPRAMRGGVENILRRFAGARVAFTTAHFLRPRRRASNIAAETPAESAAEEVEAVATGTESALETPTTSAPFGAPVTADAISQAQVKRIVPINLTRKRFSADVNWLGHCSTTSGADATKSRGHSWIRRHQAETYLNERLTACGECWKLDAKTRKMLGLPRRSNSPNEENRRAYH